MKHTFIGCEIESYAFAVKIVPLTGKNETAVEIDAVLVCGVMRLHRLLHKLTLFVIRSREDDNHFVTRFRLEIDTLCYPDQNVLSTSEIEFVIRPIGVGVVRRFKVKIGFAESV